MARDENASDYTPLARRYAFLAISFDKASDSDGRNAWQEGFP